MKIPYIITIGKKEIENSTLSVRKFGEIRTENLSISELMHNVLDTVSIFSY